MRGDSTVSVHIVTYNSAEDIADCLKAIFKQTFPVQEIVIIDNASTDRTIEIVESFMNHPIPIKLVINENNIGFAAAHNQAINITQTSYVLVLNPDVFLHPDYLFHLVSAMESERGIGSATGKLYRKSSEIDNMRILDSTGLVITKSRRAFDRGAGEIDRGQWDMSKDIFGVSGAAALYSRRMIEDVSINGEFFDTDFFAYKEDVDLAWRAQLYGWKSLFVPLAIAEHKRGWSEKKDRNQVPLNIRMHSFINRYFMMVKNDRLLYVLLHIFFIVTFECASFAYILIKERELMKSYIMVIKLLPKMWAKRKKIIRLAKKRKFLFNSVYHYFK
jgi:GT2 family glycosyltransferase